MGRRRNPADRRPVSAQHVAPRITDLPDVSSPHRKNILLPFFRNMWFYPRVLFRLGGAFGQSPQTLEQDAVDVLIAPGGRDRYGRQSRVVLIPRRWDQAGRRRSGGDGGYQARHSRESAE